jgi:hypothetical protein
LSQMTNLSGPASVNRASIEVQQTDHVPMTAFAPCSSIA